MLQVWSHVIYLLSSAAITVWVARTLHTNGRVFLVQTFHGNEDLADAVNQLLVVGFYLVNLGYVAVALGWGTPFTTLAGAIEDVSTKVGRVLLILGTMHFGNLLAFGAIRRGRLRIPGLA